MNSVDIFHRLHLRPCFGCPLHLFTQQERWIYRSNCQVVVVHQDMLRVAHRHCIAWTELCGKTNLENDDRLVDRYIWL